VPALLLASERFENLAHTVFSGRKLPNAPMVVLPGNPELVPAEQFDDYVRQILDELGRQLVRPAEAGAVGARR
jgi:hypothetical protein